MSRHRLLTPDGLAPATGFSYGVIAAEGTPVYLAGITGHHEDTTIDEGLVDQFAAACRTVATVLAEAGGEPEDVVSITIYTSAIDDYRASLEPIGEAYRAVFGHHYPAMALIGVSELFDDRALVELVCVAFV